MYLIKKIAAYLQNRHRGLILALLLAVGLVYLPYINNTLFFDDLPFFASAASNFAELPFSFDLRWLPYASLGWTWKMFSDTPLPLHLGNIMLHSANTVLVFVLLQQLCNFILNNQNKNSQAANKISTLSAFFTSHASWGAWLGALAFACHPVAVYAVGYVVERSILMATLFMLTMLLAYISGLTSNTKPQQVIWLTFSVFFYFLAVFSKEHSLLAPAVLIAITILLKPHTRANWIALATTWLGFIMIALFVTLKMKGIFGVAYEHDAAALFDQQAVVNSQQNLHLLSISTQAGLFFKYLFLWLVPNPAWMSIDMREPFASTIGAWQNWLKVACFIAYGAIALKLLLKRGKAGLLGFALLYPWLLFFIEFSSVRVQEPFVLYRSYLWAPGLLFLIPLGLDSLPKRKAVTIAFAVVILALIPLSWNRLNVFSDEYKLWNDAALLLKNDKQPGAARIFYNRGLADLHQQKQKAAVLDFKRVLAIDPTIYQAHENLGSAYLGTGQFKEALASLNQAIAIKPDNSQTYFAKAFALKRLNDKAGATEALTKSCALKNVSACLILTMSGKK